MRRLGAVHQIAGISCVVLLASFVTAQAPDMAEVAKKFAQSAQANAAALKAYTWQMRVQVTLKGDPKPPKLYQMRFDIDGKVEKTELTAEPQDSERERGLRGRIVEKKKEEAKEWAGELADLTKQYLTPSPAVLSTFFGAATPVTAPGGLVQIYAMNVIVPGDKMVYELDPGTQKLTRFMFNTILDSDPVDGQVEFASLPAGPNYAARTTVNVPAKQVSALIENFNYTQQ